MTVTVPTLGEVFLEFSREKLICQYWPRLVGCVESLADDQVWWRQNDASNAVGNLVLHLNGNVRQWLVTSFTGVEDARDRPGEFAAREMMSRAELLARLRETMDEASAVLGRLTEAELMRSYEIQGRSVRGLDAVYQVVEHFGMHYGQILYITKLMQGRDLGFYSGLDATGRFPGGSSPNIGI